MKKLDLYVEFEDFTKKDGTIIKIKKIYVLKDELKIPLVLKNQYGELDNQLFDKLLEITPDE